MYKQRNDVMFLFLLRLFMKVFSPLKNKNDWPAEALDHPVNFNQPGRPFWIRESGQLLILTHGRRKKF